MPRQKNVSNASSKTPKTRARYTPTEADKKTVMAATALGITQADLCKVLRISEKTLTKHYRHEIDSAAAQANIAVGGRLHQKCMEGDTAAIIWWTKTKMRWKDASRIAEDEHAKNQAAQNVMLVPMADPEQWAEAAAAAQKKLHEDADK